jgi:uncharacterized protein YjbI with pentapeptide repeats
MMKKLLILLALCSSVVLHPMRRGATAATQAATRAGTMGMRTLAVRNYGTIQHAGKLYTIAPHAKLEKADLANVVLEGGDLEGGDLKGADLGGANLKNAILSDANLEVTNLKGANLTFANLFRATISRANLGGANLGGALLAGANLEGAYLGKVNLRGADLTGANLRYANLTGANLWQVKLAAADLEGANLEGVDLTGVDMRYVKNLDKAQNVNRKGAYFGLAHATEEWHKKGKETTEEWYKQGKEKSLSWWQRIKNYVYGSVAIGAGYGVYEQTRTKAPIERINSYVTQIEDIVKKIENGTINDSQGYVQLSKIEDSIENMVTVERLGIYPSNLKPEFQDIAYSLKVLDWYLFNLKEALLFNTIKGREKEIIENLHRFSSFMVDESNTGNDAMFLKRLETLEKRLGVLGYASTRYRIEQQFKQAMQRTQQAAAQSSAKAKD